MELTIKQRNRIRVNTTDENYIHGKSRACVRVITTNEELIITELNSKMSNIQKQ